LTADEVKAKNKAHKKNPAALLLTGGPQMTGTHLRQFGLPFDKPVTIAFD
jgi:hypothetical protein